jgi:hypothetical protein
MSFTVELRGGPERGPLLASLRGVALPFEEIEKRRWEFPLLRGIDEYSITYFSWVQMRDLFDELATLAPDFEGEPRDTLERVIDLARRGSTEPHNHLVFHR